MVAELISYVNKFNYFVIENNNTLHLFPKEYLENVPTFSNQRYVTKKYKNSKDLIYARWKIQPNENHVFDLNVLIKIMMKFRKTTKTKVVDKIVVQLNRDSKKEFQKHFDAFLIKEAKKKNEMIRKELHEELSYLPPYKSTKNRKGLGILGNGGEKYLEAKKRFKS